MANGSIDARQIDDLLAFPLLTQEVGTAGAARPGTAPAPGTAPLAHIVENTLRNVLGWRPRAGDPQAFLAALRQSFTCQEVDGRSRCRWTPRGSAIGIQAELGAITGAQASLYARARNTVDQVLPLLDGLRPLRTEPDAEDIRSIRGIVRAELNEMLEEIGITGGPRVSRVDEIFLLLLGPHPEDDPERVGGQLRLLRERFGLTRSRVNTVDEERMLTDFLLLVDYVGALERAWRTQRASFFRNGQDGFLGTRLILLSRELSVLAESVHELYEALESVFIGSAERETVVLELGDGQPPMTIAELFGWVERFAAVEGPRLLQEGGRDGATAFCSTLGRLEDLVAETETIARRPSSNPIRGFHTQRVAFAVTAILAVIRRASQLAATVGWIALDEVEPATGEPGTDVEVILHGHGFVVGTEVSFGPDIEVTEAEILSEREIRAVLILPEDLPEGPVTVEVVHPETHVSVALPGAFRVTDFQMNTKP